MRTREEELLGVLTFHFGEPYTPNDRELRWVDLFARMAAHLVERARAEAALRESQEKLAADLANTELLRDLAERLVTEENAKTIYDEILSTAMAVLQAAAGTIQINHSQTKSLELLAGKNFSLLIGDHFSRVDASSRTEIARFRGHQPRFRKRCPNADDPSPVCS